MQGTCLVFTRCSNGLVLFRFSDVIFGAAMSYVIGKSVARHHLEDGSQIRILPSVDPNSGSVELLVEVPYGHG